jgi:hypothetical protein
MLDLGKGRGAAPRGVGRAWMQEIEVGVASLRARVRCSRTPRGSDGTRAGTVETVDGMLDAALRAARGEEPPRRPVLSWWRGTDIEAAFGHLHRAEAEAVRLYTDDEVDAEVPAALSRVELALHRDDPIRLAARKLVTMRNGSARRTWLRRVVEAGHEASDRQHTRVRNLRNVILVTTLLITVLDVVFAGVAFLRPALIPLCFGGPPSAQPLACPTGDGPAQVPGAWDLVVVALLGLLGGSLSAAVSIRTMRGTATPYDIPVCLALLKVPTGALTAVGALIAIRGQFVPGLSALDSQEQILAYALVFGYAQQLLTGMIDRRARDVLDNLAGPKDPEQKRPEIELVPRAGAASPDAH